MSTTQKAVSQYGSITAERLANAKGHLSDLNANLRITSVDQYGAQGIEIVGEVNQGALVCKPKIIIKPDESLLCSCQCGAWYRNESQGKGAYCMHTLAMGILFDGDEGEVDPDTLAPSTRAFGGGTGNSTPRAPRAPKVAGAPSQSKQAKIDQFREKVSGTIQKAIDKLAERVEAYFISNDTRVPFLSGGTGTGKTSAVRAVCDKFGYQFVFFSGDATTTFDTAWGVDVGNLQSKDKEFSWAFRFAREGIKTVLFIDEMLRLDFRFRDAMMKLIQPERAKDVRAMLARTSNPLPTDMPDETLLYVGKANFWEMQWCPAENLRFVVAANPWGDNRVDAAFARRCMPIHVEYDKDVLKYFSPSIKNVVEKTWEMYAQGTIQLPIEYGNLAHAKAADDREMVEVYMSQLQLSDVSHYIAVQAELSAIAW